MEHSNFLPSTEKRKALRLTAAALVLGTTATFVSGCGGEANSPQPAASESAPSAHLGPPNPALQQSNDEVLRGLGQLEQECGGRLFDGAMQFFGMPSSPEQATDADHSWHVDALQAMKKADLQPTIIFEPGENMDVADLATPRYDKALQAYYANLRKHGITADDLGTFVVMPELLVGGWKDARAADFAGIVNHQVKILHETFPDAKASIMVDLQEAGQLASQLPALHDIDSVGVQAFPNKAKVVDGNVHPYMNPQTIAQLGANHPVWLNTGFPKQDGNNAYTADERKAMMNSTLGVLKDVQAKGGKVVEVNAFEQDKSGSEQAIFSLNDAARQFAVFAQALNRSGVRLSGFTAAAA